MKNDAKPSIDEAKYQRKVDGKISRLQRNPNVSSINLAYIMRFIVFCVSKSVSAARQSWYLDRLIKLAVFAGNRDAKQFTREEIDQFMAFAAKGTAWSYDAYVVTLNVFYRLLFGLDSKDKPPHCIAHLKHPETESNICPDDLITDQEKSRMMAAAKTLRWRAILSLLMDCGLRPSELRSIQVKDVKVRPQTIKVTIRGGKMAKRAKPREVFVCQNYNNFKPYFDSHSQAFNQDAWLFEEGGKPLSHEAVALGVKKVAKDAGITRNIYLYLFRHTAATFLYKNNFELARRIIGHAAGSPMSDVYVHLGSDDLEDMTLELNGISDKPIDEKKFLTDLRKVLRQNPAKLDKMLTDTINSM